MPKYQNPSGPYWTALHEAERSILWEALVTTHGDVQAASVILGVGRSYMQSRMRKLVIDPSPLRGKKIGGAPKKLKPPAPSWLADAAREP